MQTFIVSQERFCWRQKQSILKLRVKRFARRPSLSDRQGPSTVRETLNLRPHHKPSLISWQEALILQVFSVYYWYLKST